MAPHSSSLAWKIPWTKKPGGLHGVAKSQTRLSDFTFTFQFHALEKEMATHCSVLAWNLRDGGAWWAAVYGVAQSLTLLKQLSSNSSSRIINSPAKNQRSPTVQSQSAMTESSPSPSLSFSLSPFYHSVKYLSNH